MTELTKEWLQKTIAELEEERDAVPGVVNEDVANALAAMKLALASLEAEPVCVIDQSNLDYLKSGSDADVWPASRTEMGDVLLYRAVVPAPVSVPDAMEMDDDFDSAFEHGKAVGWNACRAAMLQGAENVVSRCTIQTAPALDSSPKNAESRCGKSPVIPDGWVACSERMPNDKDYVWCWGRVVGWTEDDGFEAYYDATRNKWWAVTMDGEEPVRKVTHWQPLPAAPQQE